MLGVWNFSSLLPKSHLRLRCHSERGRNIREPWLSRQAEAKHHSTRYPQHLAPAGISPLAFPILVSVGSALGIVLMAELHMRWCCSSH